MNKDKINNFITEALEKEKTDLLDWLQVRLERELSIEESNYLAIENLKYKIGRTLYFESRYLSEEELTHKILQMEDPRLSIPFIIKLVNHWHEHHEKLRTLPDTFNFISPFFN